MRPVLALALGAVFLAALGGPVMAQATQAPGAAAQQEKMKSCNAAASAKSLGGDARTSFMQRCLRMTAVTPPRQESCSADASTRKLRGAARTAFMKKCVG